MKCSNNIKGIKQLLMIFFLTKGLLAFGEDINITGTVTSSTGMDIQGATVTLVNMNISVSTDVNGRYQMLNMTNNTQLVDFQNQSRLLLSGSKVGFNLTSGQQINLSLYNINGQLRKVIVNRFLSAGDHEFNLEREYGDYRVYVLKFTAENGTRIYKLSGNNLQIQSGNNISLKKSAAVLDSISVTAEGYIAEIVPVDNYISEVDVVLSEEPCSNMLLTGNTLNKGKFLCSPNGVYEFGVSTTGDLVLKSGSDVLWSANISSGIYMRVQGDGNFLVRNYSETTLWRTGTVGYSGAILYLDDNGVVILKAGSKNLWSVNSDGVIDQCLNDPDKTEPGICGCGNPEGTCNTSSCGDGELSRGGKLESGPLVGHTTDSSAIIWAYAPGSNLQIKYYLKDCSGEAITMDMPDGGGYTSLIELTGLTANKSYEYMVIENGKIAVVGSFKTAPEPLKPGKFTYLFGSGVKISHPDQPVWDEVMNLKPVFQIFGGDNVYPNSTNYNTIWDHHKIQRRIPNYAEAIRTIPTLAIWDDHDYADNNSDGNAPGKENSLRAFKDLWANPSYGTPSVPGIFSTFTWGDVQYFLMDNRYNKMNGEYLGSNQMNWLKNELEKSTAVFKIIVHGGTIRKAGDESWFEYSSSEKNELLNFIKDKHITGILFHGGDVHNNWYNTYPKCPNGGSNEYDVFEIVSSGWTYKSEFVHLEVNTTGSLPTIKYYFHEEGNVVQIGVFTLESDGRMRHNYLLDANEHTCPEGEPDPAYAFPE